MEQDYLQLRVLEVASRVFACGPLFETDLTLLAKQGVRSVVSTRPDNESPGQPLSADLAKAAEDLGIVFVHCPIEPGPVRGPAVEKFAAACEPLKRPLFVSSHSGGRATQIWETAELL